jgi:hypothetical protein
MKPPKERNISMLIFFNNRHGGHDHPKCGESLGSVEGKEEIQIGHKAEGFINHIARIIEKIDNHGRGVKW